METSNFRSELHVAQQSRRDKLRVLQHNHHNPNHPDQNVAEIYSSNNQHHMDQFSGGTNNTMNPDLVHLRTSFSRYGNSSSNLSYEPTTSTVYSSDNMLQALLVHHHNHSDSDKRIASSAGGDDNSSFGNNSAKMIISGADPQNCSPWKSMITGGGGGGGQESCDWVSCSTIDGNHPNPAIFVAEGLKANNNSSSSPAISAVYNMKQQHQQQPQQSVLLNYAYHQDLRSSSSLTGPSGENNSTHKQYGDMHFYHNNNNIGSFHEVTSATNSNANNNSRETGRVSNWSNPAGNELVLLPAFADHVNAMDYSENKVTGVAGDNSNTQVLSLSLSSVPSSKQHLGGGTQASEKLPADYMCGLNVKPRQPPPPLTSSYDTVVGNSAAFAQRGSGPLGPFTGYATILKSSKFLRPAQQLMDEFCNILAPKSFNVLQSASPADKVSARIGVTGTTDHQSVVGGFTGGDSGGSSSTFFSSNEKMVRDAGGLSSSNHESYKPEYLQKKAKLMYMQDEVCNFKIFFNLLMHFYCQNLYF